MLRSLLIILSFLATAKSSLHKQGITIIGRQKTNHGLSSNEKKDRNQSNRPDSPVDWPPQSNPIDQSAMEHSQFVPFGKKIPRLPGIKYFVSSGLQECMLCRRIIQHAEDYGHGFYNLCNNEVSAAKPMCEAQHKVLGSCPEFQQDWCYADNGGGDQQLLSPCPAVLKCHYCLGINPLHCIKRGEYGTYEGM